MTSDENSLRYEGWHVAAASGVGVFFASLFFFAFPVLLNPLCAEFLWSREEVSSAYGSMTLAASLSAPLVGHLFDRFGPKYISGPGPLVARCAFASLAALTANLWHLYAVFAVVGFAVTATSAVVYSRVVSTWFDRRRGVALGVVI